MPATVEKLQQIISQQQNDIIMLEIERDGLKEEIKKLKERNNNQGTAKKCPDGGWYKP
jgi:cell division protein FtsB